MEISPCRQCDHIAEDKSKFSACMSCSKIGGKTSQQFAGRAYIIDFKSIGDGGSKLNTDEKQSVNDFIEKECEKAGISAARLLSSERKKELAALRRHLAIELKNKFSLTQAAIAAALNLTVSCISGYFKTLKNTAPEKVDPPSQQSETKLSSLEIRKKDYFILDFTDHDDLYECFLKYSEEQLRTPENQIIYIVMQEVNAWRKMQ